MSKTPNKQNPENVRDNVALYLRLASYIKPYWKIFALSISGMVVLAATEPTLAALMKPLMDGSFGNQNIEEIRFVPLALIGLFFVRGLSQYIATVALAWISQRMVTDLRQAMFGRILVLPSQFFDNTSTGSLISKVAYDVNQVAGAVTTAMMVLVKDTLIIIGLLGWMLYLNWHLTLFALISAPVIAYIVKKISKRLRTSSRGLQEAMGDMGHVMEESINGQRVVKIFDGQEHEYKRFSKASEDVRNYTMKFIRASNFNTPIVQFVNSLSVSAIIYFALLLSVDGSITIGGFASFVVAMAMLFSPIKRLTGINEHLQKGLAAAESIFALIDEPEEQIEQGRKLDKIQGEIRFDGVTLSYLHTPHNDEKEEEHHRKHKKLPALQDISLSIQAGETVALVGESGSGKTSLANLIPRFYNPSAGRVLVDGKDISEFKLHDLRRQIAMVNQDTILFSGRVIENIAYGPMQDMPVEAVSNAAKAAYIWDFIDTQPQGLDMQIGEHGSRLSGGQKQRLAIARAFLKDAPILIFDEATSALDPTSERMIQQALNTLKQGRTTLIIAHRLSTIKDADRIIVMDQGRIVEQGPHDELLAKGGSYAKLYQSQASAHED